MKLHLKEMARGGKQAQSASSELKGRELLDMAFGKDRRGKRGPYYSASEAQLLEEAKKYSGRGDCWKNNNSLHYKLWKGHLLDRAFGKVRSGKYGRYHSATDAELLEDAKKYSGRRDCARKNSSLYQELLRREKASDAACPIRTGWKSEQIIEYGGIEGLCRLELDELRRVWQEWHASDNRNAIAIIMDNMEQMYTDPNNPSKEWLITVLSWEWHVAELTDALVVTLDELKLK